MNIPDPDNLRMGKKSYKKMFNLIERIVLILLSLGLFYFFSKHQHAEQINTKPAKEKSQSVVVTHQENISKDELVFSFDWGEIVFDDFIERRVAHVINKAQKKVYAQAYTLGGGKIVDALTHAYKRGVDVQVVAGKNKKKRLHKFPVTVFAPYRGIVHEKYILVDDATVIIMSRNLTGGVSKNSALIFKDVPKLIRLLSEEFDRMKNRRIKRICKKGCPFEFGMAYFSPGKACVNVKKSIMKAKKNIFLALYTVTPGTPMMTGLKKMLKKGVNVKAIVDDWAFRGQRKTNWKATEYLKSLGASVQYDKLFYKKRSMNFHHKFAVVDDTVLIFGSMNWTKSGCYKNRELTLIINKKEIVSVFNGYFQNLYKPRETPIIPL